MSAQSGLQKRFREIAGTAYDWNGDMIAASELLTGQTGGDANAHLFRLCKAATGSTQPDLPGQLAAYAQMFGATNWSSCGFDNWPSNWDPSVTPPADFSLTAGSGNGGDTGYYTTIYGSISNEPFPSFPLTEFATRNSNYFQVSFSGNCLDLVKNYQPVIDGVTLGAMSSAWAFDGTYTTATWDSTGAMVETQTYNVTWTQIGS